MLSFCIEFIFQKISAHVENFYFLSVLFLFSLSYFLLDSVFYFVSYSRLFSITFYCLLIRVVIFPFFCIIIYHSLSWFLSFFSILSQQNSTGTPYFSSHRAQLIQTQIRLRLVGGADGEGLRYPSKGDGRGVPRACPSSGSRRDETQAPPPSPALPPSGWPRRRLHGLLGELSDGVHS